MSPGNVWCYISGLIIIIIIIIKSKLGNIPGPPDRRFEYPIHSEYT